MKKLDWEERVPATGTGQIVHCTFTFILHFRSKFTQNRRKLKQKNKNTKISIDEIKTENRKRIEKKKKL